MDVILAAMSSAEQLAVVLLIVVVAIAAILMWRTIAPPKRDRKKEETPPPDAAENGEESGEESVKESGKELPPRNQPPQRPLSEPEQKAEPETEPAPEPETETETESAKETEPETEIGSVRAFAEEPTPADTGYDGQDEPYDGGYDEGYDVYATPTLDEVFSSDTEGEDDTDDAEYEEAELAEDAAGEFRSGRPRYTFVSKLKATTPANRAIYNAVKNEILSYRGMKSRVVNGGDYFRKRGKHLVKIVLIGRTMRMAIALNPADYDYNIYHQRDRSGMKKYADTPMFVKVQSRVGVYRAAKLIADVMEREGRKKNKKYIALDYAREIMLTDTERQSSAPRNRAE